MKAIAALLLCALAAASAAPWSDSVKLENPSDGYMHADVQDIPVLQSGVTLKLQPSDTSCKFDLCWTWLVRAPNENSDEWPKMCAFLMRDWDSSTTITTQRVNPGVGHVNLYTTKSSCTATVQLSGTSCEEDTYGPGCTGLFDAPFEELELEPGEVVLFTAEPMNRWFTNRFDVTITEASDKTFDFYYREGDAPRPATETDPSVYDQGGSFTGAGTISIVNPRNLGHAHESIFTKIFAVRNPGSSNIKVTQTQNETACENWLYGEKCKYRAPPLVGEYAYQLPNDQKEWVYGSIILTSAEDQPEQFTMGVTTLDGQEAPAMYLRYGAIPDGDTYDMKVGVRTTETRYYQSGTTLTRAGRWFWAAHIARTAQKGAYGMWFNTECPNSCSKHGQCVDNECQCDSGYTNDWFTCALQTAGRISPISVDTASDESSGMGGDEIFFIVMVSLETALLVVLAIGAALWLYSKYKPKGELDQDYEEL